MNTQSKTKKYDGGLHIDRRFVIIASITGFGFDYPGYAWFWAISAWGAAVSACFVPKTLRFFLLAKRTHLLTVVFLTFLGTFVPHIIVINSIFADRSMNFAVGATFLFVLGAYFYLEFFYTEKWLARNGWELDEKLNSF